MPAFPRKLIWVLLALAVLVPLLQPVLPDVVSNYRLFLVTTMIIAAIAVLGLNLLTGFFFFPFILIITIIIRNTLVFRFLILDKRIYDVVLGSIHDNREDEHDEDDLENLIAFGPF